MKQSLVIIGAGGFAYECYLYIQQRMAAGDSTIAFRGFAAKNCTTVKTYGLEKLFLGDEDALKFSENDRVIIAIGDPFVRKAVFERFERKGILFYNLVALTALVREEVLQGTRGSIFCRNSTTVSLGFGDGNVVNSFSTLAHDTCAGNFNVLSGYCDITGGATMGDLNFFGSHAVMLPASRIGNGNRVAAAAVIYKKFRDNTVIMGNPAAPVGSVQ